MPSSTHAQAHGTFQYRVIERRAELEQVVLNRVYAIATPTDRTERGYVDGLRDTVSAAIDYGLDVLRGSAPAVPAQLLSQARLAARSNVGLDSVLRRYCAGHTLFSDLLIEEAEASGLPRSELRRVFRAISSSLDRILDEVSEEYERSASRESHGGEKRIAQVVEGLLAGELVDPSDLRYDFRSWHLGLVGGAWGVADVLRGLAARFDRSLLFTGPDTEMNWAWLGGRRPFDRIERDELVAGLCASISHPIAIGEPAEGLAGWRLTHRQAVATLPIAKRGKQQVAQYAEAPLLASTLHDDLLATSLRELYLEPLLEERDGGVTAQQTLRAYFAAGGNASSAAAALGVTRHTVSSRIAAIEERFGRSVDGSSAEIETALRLAEIDGI